MMSATAFGQTSNPGNSDTWLSSAPDRMLYLPGCGRLERPFSSSRQGTLETLPHTDPMLSISTSSHTFNWQLLVGCAWRAEKRAASVQETNAAENLFELRRLTGFTWQHLADLLKVDRRTLHNWVKGGRIRKANQQHIAETLSVLLYADRGSAEENAAAINEPFLMGETPFQAIQAGQYLVARRFLSHGQSRSWPARSARSASGRASWMGEFQPLLMHEDADGSETIGALPDEPRPAPRKRRIKRGRGYGAGD